MRHLFLVLALAMGTSQCARANDDTDDHPSRAAAAVVDAPAAVKVPLDGLPVYGSPRALVTIVAFVDYECPYCARANGTLAALREAYGDRLRVAIASHPLPIHPHAEDAARAFLAAERLGRGDVMHAKLFTGPHPVDEDAIHVDAVAAGLDADAFDAARRDPSTLDELRRIRALAHLLEADGAPIFFVNGRRLVGAQPLATFRALVDEEMRSAERLVARGVPPERVYATIQGRAPAYVAQPKSAEPDLVVDVPVKDAPVRGPARAPVTVVLFSDFECPYCVRLESTLRELERARPDDVRIVFRQKPLPMHEHARLAAKASLAAAAQGRFWEYHDVLVAHRDALDRASLERHAAAAGLDVGRFARDLDDPALDAKLAAEDAVAASLDVKGTPTSFVNGHRVVGAQPLETYLALVDRLKSAAAR